MCSIYLCSVDYSQNIISVKDLVCLVGFLTIIQTGSPAHNSMPWRGLTSEQAVFRPYIGVNLRQECKKNLQRKCFMFLT